jgi:hypothetical protein
MCQVGNTDRYHNNQNHPDNTEDPQRGNRGAAPRDSPHRYPGWRPGSADWPRSTMDHKSWDNRFAGSDDNARSSHSTVRRSID